MSDIKIATSWDSINPILYDGDEAISLRVLEKRYRDMERDIERLTQQLEEAKRDAAIMAKAFRKYARHEYECRYRLGEPDPCGMLQMMHKAHDITAIKE